MTSPKLTLVSDPICPFVQRAAIALLEKDVAFERVNVDLKAKPDWFLSISPLGKVPLLKVERDGTEAVIFESNVICEYIEETQPGRRLHPEDPLTRASHRGWMEFASQVLADLWRVMVAKTESDLAAATATTRAKLERVETVLSGSRYFAGDEFSYVDAAFAPAFRQLRAIDGIRETGLLDGLPKVRAWAEALLARPSVASVEPKDYAARIRAVVEDGGGYLLEAA